MVCDLECVFLPMFLDSGSALKVCVCFCIFFSSRTLFFLSRIRRNSLYCRCWNPWTPHHLLTKGITADWELREQIVIGKKMNIVAWNSRPLETDYKALWFSGWATGPEDDRDRQFRLSIYHAVKDDSGVFSCMTPRGKTNSIVIKVLPVECPLIMPFVPRLLANTSSTRMGTHVSFNCPRGYRLDGPHHLECFPTGHWSDRLPSCSTILCPPINITNPKLRMYSSSRDPQNLAEFSCPSGYRLKGAGTAKCTETGTWSNEPPFCEGE